MISLMTEQANSPGFQGDASRWENSLRAMISWVEQSKTASPVLAYASDNAREILGSSDRQDPGYQYRVKYWVLACFGEVIAANKLERNQRFLEEALELVQACGLSKTDCLRLIDYVYNREAGERSQEVGGVMVTLAALCNAWHVDMQTAAEKELTRVWSCVNKIRLKQQSKNNALSPIPIGQGAGAGDDHFYSDDALLEKIGLDPSTHAVISISSKCQVRTGASKYQTIALPSPLGRVKASNLETGEIIVKIASLDKRHAQP